jgi:integrase/recombinase XerD
MSSPIQSFKNYLHSVGYADSTVKMLPALVNEFLEFIRVEDAFSPSFGGVGEAVFIEQEKLKLFFGHLQTRPLQKRSGALSEMMISHYVYALKTFFSWCEVTGQIDYNPISGMKFKRPRQNHREPLSQAEMTQLFAAADSLKQTALLHIFYSCGLRRSEGEALNISDVQFKNRLLYVREGKGAKRRVIPLTARVAADLEAYYLQERTAPSIPQRGKLKPCDTEAFVLNERGGRMSGDGYNKIVKQLIEKAGIPPSGGGGASLHHLRHSIATHLLQSGMSMHYVRDFLGHSFLETTQVYAKPKYEQLKLL